MHTMGLEAIEPRPRLSVRHVEQQVSPDVLHDGVMSLVAILDWYSRSVLSWQLSNTMDGAFCVMAWEQALAQGRPEVFNTDQGAQCTALAFTTRVAAAHVAISRDGRGRVLDNIFVERLWRTVKYEDMYLKDYGSVLEMEAGLAAYFWFYNHQRIHQALDYRTPAEVHFYHEQREEAYLC
jgi:putative transposase